jgi:hypothetical protein
MPPRPWLPITIRSAGHSLAALTISVSGLPTWMKSSAVACGGRRLRKSSISFLASSLAEATKTSGWNAGVGGVYELGVDDMNERHLRPREARQLDADISRMGRDGLVVDSNENLLKEHDGLLELRGTPRMRLTLSGGQTLIGFMGRNRR